VNRGDDASRAQNIFFRIFINVSPRRGATRSTLALDAAPPCRATPRLIEKAPCPTDRLESF